MSYCVSATRKPSGLKTITGASASISPHGSAMQPLVGTPVNPHARGTPQASWPPRRQRGREGDETVSRLCGVGAGEQFNPCGTFRRHAFWAPSFDRAQGEHLLRAPFSLSPPKDALLSQRSCDTPAVAALRGSLGTYCQGVLLQLLRRRTGRLKGSHFCLLRGALK